MKNKVKKNMKSWEFQRVKNMSLAGFWSWMNQYHSRAYFLAVKHYEEAMDIELTKPQKAKVVSKAEEIRDTWDGLDKVTIDKVKELDDA